MRKAILASTIVSLGLLLGACGPVGLAKTTVKTAGKATVGTVRTVGRAAF